MYQVETSENLEGAFRGGLINRGKNVLKRFDSLYKLPGLSKAIKVFRSLTSSWGNLTGSVLTKEPSMWYSFGIGIFCLTEVGEQQIDWLLEKD